MCFASSLFDARTGERGRRGKERGRKEGKKTPSCRCLLNRAKVDRRYTISWKVCNLMIIHLADKDGSAVTYQLYSRRDGGFSAGGVEKWLKKFPCWVFFSFNLCTNEVRKTRERSVFTFYTKNNLNMYCMLYAAFWGCNCYLGLLNRKCNWLTGYVATRLAVS